MKHPITTTGAGIAAIAATLLLSDCPAMWAPLLSLLVHAGAAHLLADLLGLFIIGWWIESHLGSVRMLIAILGAACCTEIAHDWLYPEHHWQFGLSGVVYFLAGFGLITRTPMQRWQMVVLGLLAARIAIECHMDSTMMTASLGGFSNLGSRIDPVEVVAIPMVHAVTIMTGLLAGIVTLLLNKMPRTTVPRRALTPPATAHPR